MSFNNNSFGDDFGENTTDEVLFTQKSETLINEHHNDVDHIHKQYVNFTNETSTSADKSVKKGRKTAFEMKDRKKKELLVELVKGEELIWNKQHTSHWNSKAMSAAWKRIAGEMVDTPVYQCRAMWKSLKDALRYQNQKKSDKRKCSDYWSENESQRESELRDLLYFLEPTFAEASRRDSCSDKADTSSLDNLIEPFDPITDLTHTVKINTKQKIILFDAMARNRHILDGRITEFCTRRTRNALWQKLAAKLNIYGPEKDVSQWKRCWSDLRLFMRKKYVNKMTQQDNKLTENEKRIVKACGIKYNEVEGSDGTQSDSDVMEVAEEAEIKQEQHDGRVPIVFEIVDIQSERDTGTQIHNAITDDRLPQEPMSEVVKIEDIPVSPEETEDIPLSPKETEHEPESAYSPRESRRHQMQSINNFQSITPNNNLNTNGIEYFPDEAIIEIRRMHRNLLRESKKQTALLQQLVNRLAPQ